MILVSEICTMLVCIQMQEKFEDYVVNLSEDIDVEYDHMSKHEDSGGEDDIDVNILDDSNRVAIDMDYKKITKLTGDDIFGLEFGSKSEACEFYSTYGKCHGFVSIRYDRQGNIIIHQLLYNREGFHDEKHVNKVDRHKGHKLITQTNCQAKFSGLPGS